MPLNRFYNSDWNPKPLYGDFKKTHEGMLSMAGAGVGLAMQGTSNLGGGGLSRDFGNFGPPGGPITGGGGITGPQGQTANIGGGGGGIKGGGLTKTSFTPKLR